MNAISEIDCPISHCGIVDAFTSRRCPGDQFRARVGSGRSPAPPNRPGMRGATTEHGASKPVGERHHGPTRPIITLSTFAQNLNPTPAPNEHLTIVPSLQEAPSWASLRLFRFRNNKLDPCKPLSAPSRDTLRFATMSRFLGPRDIGLLQLISIYSEAAVPSDGLLPVLHFLARHIGTDLNRDSPDADSRFRKAQDDIDLVKSIKAFETLLQPFSAAVGLPGRRLWDLFLAKLWAIDSLDALHHFFDQLPSLLATKEDTRLMLEPEEGASITRIPLTLHSPFALFVRRAQLEFSRLPFSDASNLWKDFIVYRQPTAAAWMRRKPSSSSGHFDKVLEISEPDWGQGAASLESITYGDLSNARVPVSANCLDNLIEFQVAQMQSESKPC